MNNASDGYSSSMVKFPIVNISQAYFGFFRMRGRNIIITIFHTNFDITPFYITVLC